MRLDQIVAALKDRNLKEVERQTGIGYHTLSRIRNGKTRRPDYETTRKIAEYLKEQVS
jgi:transcriptional regulator with XRE-family HTH domain